MKPSDAFGWLRRRKPKPKPFPPTPYGTKAAAGPFSGCLMLGSNPDVWEQAFSIPCRSVALPPSTPVSIADRFREAGKLVVAWQPPETAAGSDPEGLVDRFRAAGYIGQAEGQGEWDIAALNCRNVSVPAGIVCNWWGYGRYPAGVVALPEQYANEHLVDFGEFVHYQEQGAAAVVPVCGVYHTDHVSDVQAASIYAGLSGRGLPGVAAYAGEDPVTAASLNVLTNLWRG